MRPTSPPPPRAASSAPASGAAAAARGASTPTAGCWTVPSSARGSGGGGGGGGPGLAGFGKKEGRGGPGCRKRARRLGRRRARVGGVEAAPAYPAGRGGRLGRKSLLQAGRADGKKRRGRPLPAPRRRPASRPPLRAHCTGGARDGAPPLPKCQAARRRQPLDGNLPRRHLGHHERQVIRC